MNPAELTVERFEFPRPGYGRGWYVTAPEYDHIQAGPFATKDRAAAHLQHIIDNYEPPNPPGWEGGFADNH